ncbi:glycogen-binding domain-containing protein [uncultured Pseudodesulfovibrio sp.]|uniref:glycogen-binding domain-containing protein n=1 Tax=uncultured Pseudodesulfovibrio sp. TaxID=2035858 RepID=UPI0029C67753|nr:glycogen-binding domain-containing protein [uncultured Pseudodesulfovibrio sp.]
MKNIHQKKLSDETIAQGIRSASESRPPADFVSRVMDGLEPKRLSFWTRVRLWLTEPRSMTFTPLRLIPAVATVVVLLAAGIWQFDRQYVPGNGNQPVRFVFRSDAVPASNVAVIGSFNNWQATGSMMRYDRSAEAWVLDMPLPPGNHEYMFLIDGEKFVEDPSAPLGRDDGFGNRNSIIIVDGAYEQAL